MDEEKLKTANELVRKIEYYTKKTEKISWYKRNNELNKSTIVGFGTTSTRSIDAESMICDEIFSTDELLISYINLLASKVVDLKNELKKL